MLWRDDQLYLADQECFPEEGMALEPSFLYYVAEALWIHSGIPTMYPGLDFGSGRLK